LTAKKRLPKKRSYHHGDLRHALIEEAVRMLRGTPPEALSMRELARRLDVSLAAPHHHFAEKDDLFAAIAETAFVELATRLVAHLRGTPRERLRAIARTYLVFAYEEPMRYRVMYLPQLADRTRFAALHETGGRALQLLTAVFAEAGSERPYSRAIACWSTLHGFALLGIDELLPDASAQLREDVIEAASAI
jgi:AcrR family transcriptional regulator